MTDRELLELAAKAAGLDDAEYRDIRGWGEVRYGQSEAMWSGKRYEECGSGYWNPLTDDGDALRLAVKLRISLVHEQEYMGGPVMETLEAITQPKSGDGFRTCMTDCLNDQGADEMAAARRAITRAAAEIGKERTG